MVRSIAADGWNRLYKGLSFALQEAAASGKDCRTIIATAMVRQKAVVSGLAVAELEWG